MSLHPKNTKDKSILVLLYKTLVRPHLEYAAAVWSPWTEKDVDMLEKVQRRLVKMLCDARGQTYEEKMEDAGLTTLKERRNRGDLIETFKTIKGFNKVQRDLWFEMQSGDGNRPTRANSQVKDGNVERKSEIIVKERAALDLRQNFYTMRVVREWNGIPEDVKNEKTVNGFKNALDKWKMEEKREKKVFEKKTKI